MASKKFNVKNGLTAGDVTIYAANSTIATVNLAVSGNSNIGSIANLTITGGSSGQVLTTYGNGSLYWSTAGGGSSSSISNGTSNVNIPSANGNVNISASGNANVLVVTGTGVNVAGTLNATGNANVGNIGATRGVFTNIAGEGGNISNIQGANVSGAVASATSATTAGTVTTNAQPNITSIGALTALNVSGNVSLTGANVSLGSVANLKITGGTNGYVLSTDGTGNLSWISAGAGNTSYVYTQSTPATTWTINHNLGVQYVNIQVIDSTGKSFTGRYNYPTITFTNTTHCTVTFDSAQAGYAAVTSGAGQVGPQGIPGATSGGIIANGTSNVSILTADGNITAGIGGTANVMILTTTGANFTGYVNATGNVEATYFIGNGSQLTGIDATTIQNGTANVRTFNNANITVSAAGNANIFTVTGTGVDVAGTLNVTGNANVNNLGAAQVLATANITAPQVIANVAQGTAPLLVNSTTLVSNLNADLLDGYNSAVANTANTVAVRDANGNVSANYFVGNGAFLTGVVTSVSNITNGTSNVNIASSGANVTVSVAGNANILTVTGTGANVTGTLNVSGAFAATSKSFLIDHPTKEGMKLRYGSLEGPENGVYVRGRLNGNNIIELPDYWSGLVDENTFTVNLTPIGKTQDMYVANIEKDRITIGADSVENIDCFYIVFAERKDVDKLVVEF